MKRVLTDAFIRSLRAPANGRLEVSDAACRGLALRITANNVRSWCYRYSDPTGIMQRMTIGGYPAIGLSDARLRADALRRDLANGSDPVAAKRQRKREARSGVKTFAHLAERYVLEHARVHNRPKTVFEIERNLRATILPAWGDRHYDSITRGDIYELIGGVARRGAPILANRLKSLICRMFAFAMDQELMQSSPAFRLKKPGKEKIGTRVLSDDEIRAFWPGIVSSPDIEKPIGLALRLALLLGLRAGEIAGLRRDELRDFADRKRAAIDLVGERTKNSRPLWLPLSPLAQDTMAHALDLSDDETFIFPNAFGTSIHVNRLGVAMKRFVEAAADPSWRKDAPTPHDLRRTLRTRLSAQGTPTEVADAIMNHAAQDIGRKHYDQHRYEAEKRLALDTWARTIERIIDGKPVTVLPLQKRRS